MSNIATTATRSVASLLTAPAGSDFALNAIAVSLGTDPPISIASILLGNSPPELFEKSLPLKYPTVNIYCEKLSNNLKEKFRTFSGFASIVVELRHSQDRIQQVQPTLENYVASACQIFDGSRGDLGDGMFYSGGYEISFGPLKRGGLNFIQIARIVLELGVSV